MTSVDGEAPVVPRIPEELLTLVGRVATFETTHQISSKRRASTTKKKTTAKENVKWPHTLPHIDALAQAGFYYKPVPESSDNVRCFTCGANLDGWEPGDDPMAEHIKHAPTCAWAIHLAIARRMEETKEETEGEEDPMCDALVEARTATFRDVWPHENKKGWKVKVKKIVDAGWCYDPSGGYDDGVKCFYCGLALDGWEPKDDPSKEHLDRRPDCPFYILKDQYAAERKAAGKKTGKGRTSRASKVSNARTSTNSVGTTFSEASSMMSPGDTTAQIDDSIMSTASTATTKGRGPAKGRKKATTSRKVSKTSKIEANNMEIDEPSQATLQQNYEVLYPDLSQADEKGNEEELPTEKPKTKAKGKKKASSSILASISSEAPVLPPIPDFSDSEVALLKPKPKRGQAKKDVIIGDNEVSVAPVKIAAEKQARDSEMSSMEAALSELTPRATKQTRGKKRDSDGMLKLDSSIMILQGTPDPPPAKATRGRKKVKLSEQPNVDSSAFDADPPASMEAPIVAAKQTKKSAARAAPKPGKGKKAASPPPVSSDPEDRLPGIEPEVETADDLAQDPIDNQRNNPDNEAEPIIVDTGATDEQRATPSPSPQAASPAPLTPTPARTGTRYIPSTSQRPTPRFSATPVQVTRSNRRTPESSPIPSDAENQPPSTLPSSKRPPPNQTTQTSHQATPPTQPLQPTTTTSTTPPTWDPTDLESIFLTSPIQQTYADINLSTLKTNDLSALKSIVEKVRASLAPEERGMSVEQWIQAVAARGEEKLRRECEALVMVFEREGVRALGVLEGVEVV